jgi:hypothetical protein
MRNPSDRACRAICDELTGGRSASMQPSRRAAAGSLRARRRFHLCIVRHQDVRRLFLQRCDVAWQPSPLSGLPAKWRRTVRRWRSDEQIHGSRSPAGVVGSDFSHPDNYSNSRPPAPPPAPFQRKETASKHNSASSVHQKDISELSSSRGTRRLATPSVVGAGPAEPIFCRPAERIAAGSSERMFLAAAARLVSILLSVGSRAWSAQLARGRGASSDNSRPRL